MLIHQDIEQSIHDCRQINAKDYIALIQRDVRVSSKANREWCDEWSDH